MKQRGLFWIAVLTSVSACSGDEGTSSGAAGSAGSGGTASPGGAAGSTSTGGAGATGGTGGGWGGNSVTVHLERRAPGGNVISFGVPFPKGAVADPALVAVTASGQAVSGLQLATLLREHGATGAATGVRSLLVQFPSSVMTGASLDVTVTWQGAANNAGTSTVAFSSVSGASPFVVETAERTIQQSGGGYALVEQNVQTRTLFAGTEPFVVATFPDGYLASTRVLGPQMSRSELAGDASLAALRFLSGELDKFARSAMYQDGYRYNPAADSVIDPIANYEGWLYDRCATFLTAYVHDGDPVFLHHALQSCSYYASKIQLTGPNRGIFTGKPDADTKYSHLRGLYAYYALTGDEAALEAGKAIADLWNTDTLFVLPYAAGSIRGVDKLWTERLLGTSLEGLFYGFALTDDARYLTTFEAELTTAHRHITTTDQPTLDAITKTAFTPQSCFIHNAEQAAEGNGDEPWCSGWMSELVLDALLAYQDQTDDPRVDDVFVQLARFLRDTGSAYFRGDVQDDFFLQPSLCWDPSNTDDPRILVPLYGSGRYANGTRNFAGDYSDYEHCTDATALASAALYSLTRKGGMASGGPFGPFATEGDSFAALHQEMVACSQYAFDGWHRTKRDPRNWTSAELNGGVGDPAAFVAANKIGYPSYPSSPQRKLSWWFNMSMLQFRLLANAAVGVHDLSRAHQVDPASCP